MTELDLDKAFSDAKNLVEKKTGAPLLSVSRMEDLYGIPGCLSTGFPSLDLHLVKANDGSYGWPYGAICEIYGQQGALKSSRIYDAAVKNVKYGSKHLGKENEGVTLLFISEPDWDKEYIMSFGKRYGLSEQDLEDAKFKVVPVGTVEEMEEVVDNFLGEYVNLADDLLNEGKNPHEHLPRFMVLLDSMAKISSEEQQKRDEDDFSESDKIGSKAKSIHSFFRKHWMNFGKLGACFLYSNHWRANITTYPHSSKYKPAHDDALKYYPSVRCEVKKGYSQKMKNRQSKKRKYDQGFPWICRVKKVRDKKTFASEVEVNYYNNRGLDYFQSLIDAARYAGIIKKTNNVYKITYYGNLILDDSNFHEEYGDIFPITEDDFREELKENISTMTVDLEQEVYERGAEEVVEEVVHVKE